MDGTCRKSYPLVGFRIGSFDHPCSVLEMFICLFLFLTDRDCVVSTATGLRAGRPGARIPAGARDLFRQVLGPIQPRVRWAPVLSPKGVKRGRILPQSAPSGAEANGECIYNSFLPQRQNGMDRDFPFYLFYCFTFNLFI